MEWSSGLLGQLNDRVVSGAVFVSLQLRNVVINYCTYVPNLLRCRRSIQLGSGAAALVLTYRPLMAPSDRSGQPVRMSIHVR